MTRRRTEIASSLPVVFGLDRLQAAASVGISATTFDKLVSAGDMPQPRLIGTRKVWDVDDLRAAFKTLPRDGETPGRDTWADVA